MPKRHTGEETRLGYEIIDIRRFEPEEFSDLLQAEAQAWHDTLFWDFTASTQIINACLRDKRLSGYALVCDGLIRGYCFFFYDGDKGIIGDIFVHPALAGLGHERRLLEHVLETLLATPGLSRIEAQLPHYESDELESSFMAPQFKNYLRRFMSLSLATRPRGDPGKVEDAGMPEDFKVISWDKRFNKDAAEMLYQAYRQHVDAAINDQYDSVRGCTRLIENIFHNQGCGDFLGRVSRMAIHRPTQKLAGILTVTAVRAGTAHIPQVGVSPSFQGLGVGTALMEAAFQDLDHEGFERVTLTVTDANSGAVRLYQRLGFKTFKAFGAFIYTSE